MRLTRLNNCGVPVVGPCSVITTDGFITAQFTPQYEAGTETTVKNAAGAIAIQDKAPDVLKQWDVALTFVGINPDASEMLAGYDAVLDNQGDTVGMDFGEDVQEAGVAIEIWTDVAAAACAGGVSRYGYLLLPWTTGFRVTSDITVQNDAVNGALTGLTKRGSPWGLGPYDVVMNDGAPDVAGPLLTPIGAKTHMRLLATTVPPPTVDPDECGCTALAA